MADETIWSKVSRIASDTPGMMITIGSGLAGLLMPSPSGSAAANLLNGEFEGFFDAVAYNYAGINTKSNSNSLGSMFRRAKGAWAAIGGKILKSVYQSF
jgi:hypothetical protein